MYWEPMSVDEFAEYRRGEGMKLANLDGIWWAEVRPCFFRPLFPFCEITPWSRRYPLKALLGGVLHLVPPSTPTGSCLNLHVYDDLQQYSLDVLSPKRRKITRDALARFTCCSITDPGEFVESAYRVYRVFYQRTQYWYKSDRLEKEKFREWAKNLYRFPKIAKIGVYQEARLAAVETSFRAENVIFGDNLFSDDVSLKANVMDFLTHRLREAAACSDARYFFSGLPTGVASLDNSKTKKGCTLLRLPVYCKINPLALSVAKFLMKDSYRKLMTVMAQQTEEKPLPQGAGSV